VISGYLAETNAELHRRSSGVAERSLHIEGRGDRTFAKGLPDGPPHELALA